MEHNNSKIFWEKRGLKLRAKVSLKPHGHPLYGIVRESNMDPIQHWCNETECGIRTSFDTFKFKTDAEMTAFLLKWA
jgi:hypothetical protein